MLNYMSENDVFVNVKLKKLKKENKEIKVQQNSKKIFA